MNDDDRGADAAPPVRLPTAAPGQAARPGPAGRTLERAPIDSGALFEGATEVRIYHRGAVYRLKQTSLGKLILTK